MSNYLNEYGLMFPVFLNRSCATNVKEWISGLTIEILMNYMLLIDISFHASYVLNYR